VWQRAAGTISSGWRRHDCGGEAGARQDRKGQWPILRGRRAAGAISSGRGGAIGYISVPRGDRLLPPIVRI
jgi:hypothetical protein